MRRTGDVVMVVCTVLAIAGMVCNVAAWWSLPSWARATSLPGIEKRVKLRFPTGTELVQAKFQQAMDWEMFVKLRMPREAADSFLKAPPLSGKTELGDRPWPEGKEIAEAGMSEWRPEAAKHSVWSGAGQAYYGPVSSIMIDLDDPRIAVVYLYAEVF
jgi:hypothetical protein